VHICRVSRQVYADVRYRVLRSEREFADSVRRDRDIRVLRLLRPVTEDLSVLADEAGAAEARRADPLRLSEPLELRDFVASVTTWLGWQRT